MPSGGARVRSGPAPDPTSLRAASRDANDWRHLPSKREGDVPAWPSSMPRATKRDAAQWAELWTLPQAIVWEEKRQHDLVAQYVKAFAVAAYADAKAADRTVMRQLADELGLTISGMARHRWLIDDGQPAQQIEKPHDDRRRDSAKKRFTIIEGAA